MSLSPHFSLDELTHSDTAIRRGVCQTPSPVVLKQLADTADRMEVVRSILGNKPIRITSGYRSPILNKLVGGTIKSDHLTGHAVDFVCPDFGDPVKIVKVLSECPMVMFDQLICEGTWVHISFKSPFRREVLTAHFGTTGTTYTKGVA
jgi:hypothetical protein